MCREENILHTARSTPNTAFLHDVFGNVTNATDMAGNSWQFTYSANSTLTNEVFTSLRLCDSARQTNALSRLIDAYSRPAGYNLAIGDTPRSRMRYGYDNEGRIATLAATNATNRGFQVAYLNEAGYNYGYTLTTPNGATLTRTVTRDPYRRSLTLDCTTRFNNVVVASFVYTFDAHNRPVARNNDRFAYNDRDEITSALIGTNRINRAYDTIGNHVFCSYNAATNFYANNQLNQTTASYVCAPSVGSADNDAPPQFDGYDILSTNKLTWSAQGGLQRDGRFIYAFDAEDQLVSVTSDTLTNGAIRVVNAYDYRHRRISKTVYTMRDDSPPTSPLAPPLPITHRLWHLQERHDFVYDDWNLIHETVTSVDANSTTNVAEIEYFWGPDLSNTLQGAGGVGGLLAVSLNGQFYFPIYDNLGNVVKYINENGTVVASYAYDDFGHMLFASGPLSSSFTFLFSTRYWDDELSLSYYGMRFYHTTGCFWINVDPLGEHGDANIYMFVKNNSLLYFDDVGFAGLLPTPLDFVPNPRTPRTFQESIFEFLMGGTHYTKHYYYPRDTVTVRLLRHPEVAKIWNAYRSIKNISMDYHFSRSFLSTVGTKDFIYDVLTVFETNLWLAPSGWRNVLDDDYGYQVLGSIYISYSLDEIMETCTKKLNMTIYNSWSIDSLTRNPRTRQSFLSPKMLQTMNMIWQPLRQEYHYSLEEPVSVLGIGNWKGK